MVKYFEHANNQWSDDIFTFNEFGSVGLPNTNDTQNASDISEHPLNETYSAVRQ